LIVSGDSTAPADQERISSGDASNTCNQSKLFFIGEERLEVNIELIATDFLNNF